VLGGVGLCCYIGFAIFGEGVYLIFTVGLARWARNVGVVYIWMDGQVGKGLSTKLLLRLKLIRLSFQLLEGLACLLDFWVLVSILERVLL